MANIIYNNIIPFKGFSAINLFGIIFVRKDVVVTATMLNHERIHTAQMREMLYIFFYLWYVVEWLIKVVIYAEKAYVNLSFEREAYKNSWNANYLKYRKLFSWFNYL